MLNKGSFEKKNQVWPFSHILLGLTCLHFLLKVLKTWLANLLTSIFTKTNQFDLYMFNVIYMWHVSCVITTLIRIFSVSIIFNIVTTISCLTLILKALKISVRRFARRYVRFLFLSLLNVIHILTNTKSKHVTITYYHS